MVYKRRCNDITVYKNRFYGAEAGITVQNGWDQKSKEGSGWDINREILVLSWKAWKFVNREEREERRTKLTVNDLVEVASYRDLVI